MNEVISQFCLNYAKTRLSYNCAHLRWTNETLKTLTIEYFRIVLKKDLGEYLLGENFFGLKTFGMTGAEAQKPGWQGGIAIRKVFARPKVFARNT